PCRATLRGPMTIWSRWVSGWVLRASPPDDVEAPQVHRILVAVERTVVLVAPDGLARPRPDPHDLERAHTTLAVGVVLVEEVERVLDGVDERLAGLPESKVQPRVAFQTLAHRIGLPGRMALALSHAVSFRTKRRSGRRGRITPRRVDEVAAVPSERAARSE